MTDEILTPDFDAWPVERLLASAAVDGDRVLATWRDGGVSPFNVWWLIDNSPMPEHVNRLTREPTLDLSTLPEDFHAAAAAVDADGVLAVTWSHGVAPSRYHPGWLAAHDVASGRFAGDDRPAPVHWDATLGALPGFDGRAVLTDDEVLRDWLRAVAVYGAGRLTGVPTEPGTVEAVAARIGTVRDTNFGRVFEVRSKLDADSNAYTTLELTPHVDLPTREYQPGLQILHCLENSAAGGESVLVDGYRLADALADEDPDTFRILTTTAFAFQNRARTTDYRWRSPVIVRDADGRYLEVRIAGFLRGPLAIPVDEMTAAYRALRRIFALSREPRFQIRARYAPGDLVLFDNRRLLHGRAAFDPAGGSRWLQGLYLERDELYSRLRILERRRRAEAVAQAAE